MSHFFAYMSRMKYISRWGLMRNTQNENIQEHSHQVAMVTHLLALARNRFFGGAVDCGKAVLLAIYHEAPEVITGDIATPIKYFNPEIKNAYKKIESTASRKLLDMIPEELKADYEPLLTMSGIEPEYLIIIKAADKICAYLKCVEELKAGNQEFSKAEKAIRAEIDRMELPEVKYFMDKFLSSFLLTLDELN
ncbi:MAG: 5'-deoxynucleotidase [Eubacteriales bacterium]|nr:5'-deoxynucleotidase [Eubacteriales bacterium]